MSSNNRNRISHLNYLNELSPSEDYSTNDFIPDDLAMFTNTQFFDFDMNVPIQDDVTAQYREAKESVVIGEVDKQQQQQQQLGGGGAGQLDPSLEFVDYGGFDFSQALASIPPSISTIDTNVAAQAYPPAPLMQQNIPISPSSATSPASDLSPSPTTGSKRKSSVIDSTIGLSIEEQARLAAEEDKRRRNTAASARFRIKKKQREQALERTAKEMTEKVTQLESRINQLEMENKWLKNLIVEKNGSTTKEEIAEILAAKYTTTAEAMLKAKK